MSDNNDVKNVATRCRLSGQRLIDQRNLFVGCLALSAIVILFWENSKPIDYGISSPITTIYATVLNLIRKASNASNNGRIPANETPSTPRPLDVNQFVSFSGGFADGRGLGNQLFVFATVVNVAELSGRRPAILKFKYSIRLDEVFDLSNIERYDDLCPCYTFGEADSLTYDSRIELLARANNTETRDKSIFVDGFFQSWKYMRSIERRLRGYLKFKPVLQNFTDDFFERTVPPTWLRGFVRVGIHVRRGDVTCSDKIEFGYSTPNDAYFRRAMDYFLTCYERVQFIVCSNDMMSTKQYIAQELFGNNSQSVNVTYCDGWSAGHDMAVLSSCDHVIMSTGTYGWWAAWLAKGTTVFYKNWPIKGTKLDNGFTYDDFFPPSWIGME